MLSRRERRCVEAAPPEVGADRFRCRVCQKTLSKPSACRHFTTTVHHYSKKMVKDWVVVHDAHRLSNGYLKLMELQQFFARKAARRRGGRKATRRRRGGPGEATPTTEPSTETPPKSTPADTVPRELPPMRSRQTVATCRPPRFQQSQHSPGDVRSHTLGLARRPKRHSGKVPRASKAMRRRLSKEASARPQAALVMLSVRVSVWLRFSTRAHARTHARAHTCSCSTLCLAIFPQCHQGPSSSRRQQMQRSAPPT